MSSDREESFELSEDAIGKSNVEKEGLSPTKKPQDCVEHASSKGKRRGRRGKKRKQRKSSGGGAAESETQDDSPAWDSDQAFEIDPSYSDVMIRPRDVPKAPENSTQFIMDDHNKCHLYVSFETPNPYCSKSSQEGEFVNGPYEYDAAYLDVDYKYDPPDDFDSSAYYDKEFEQSYKGNRFEHLLSLPRPQLVNDLRTLESKLKDLSDDLLKENPSPVLEQLQSELLEHQERHLLLLDIYRKNSTGIKNPDDVILTKFAFEDIKSDQNEGEEYSKCFLSSRKENQTCALNDSEDESGTPKIVEEGIAKMHEEILANDVQRTNHSKRNVLGNLQQKVDRLQSELEGQCITEHKSVKESSLLLESQPVELNNDDVISCDMEDSLVLRDCRGCDEKTEAGKSSPVVA